MTDLVPADQIETIVGVPRHPKRHIVRVVSGKQTAYMLHSSECVDRRRRQGLDLRRCSYSEALDRGLDTHDWVQYLDSPMPVRIDSRGLLEPLERDFYLGVSG